MPMNSNRSILKKAQKLVYGDRNKAYGHPYNDYLCTATLWTALLHTSGTLPKSKSITPYQAALMMAAVKLSRASRQYKEDNLIDLAGYAACAHETYKKSKQKG